MNNLHLTLTPFRNESRLIKQGASLLNNKVFTEVNVIALWENGLKAEEVTREGIRVERVKLKTRKLSGMLIAQVLKYLEYSLRTILYIRHRKINVVNCHSLALLPLGVFAKKILGCKLVYDTHELETERNGLNGLRKLISTITEKRLIKYADLVIVVGERIAQHYKDRYAIEKPVVVLNVPCQRHINKTNIIRTKLGIGSDKLIYLYQGLLEKGRGIELLLKVFSSGDIDNNKVIVFMGYGGLASEIKKYQGYFGNIYFLEAVEPSRVLEYTVSADFGMSLIEPVCLSYEYSMPNKLFEYALAGIPSFASKLPEMEKVLLEEKCGYLVKPSDPEDLIDKINTSETFSVSISDKYTWQYQEGIMIQAYKDKIL